MAADAYQHIEELVQKYKENDTSAALQLIDAFENYTGKFMSLLKKKFINYDDVDTRKFLALFSDDIETRKYLKSKSNSVKVKSLIIQLVEQLNYQLSSTPEEDLQQDMSTIILLLASRYKESGKNFCSYVYNSFRYELKRTVETYINDPANLAIGSEELDTDPLYNDDYTIENILIERDDALDLNWLHGHTCSDQFAKLSTMERLILKLHYELKLSDPQISKILGVHKNTVYNRRTKAIKKVQAND